jgi:hypothetical protein
VDTQLRALFEHIPIVREQRARVFSRLGYAPSPSLPPRHFISFLLQTSIDETRVRLVGLRRTGDSMEEAG